MKRMQRRRPGASPLPRADFAGAAEEEEEDAGLAGLAEAATAAAAEAAAALLDAAGLAEAAAAADLDAGFTAGVAAAAAAVARLSAGSAAVGVLSLLLPLDWTTVADEAGEARQDALKMRRTVPFQPSQSDRRWEKRLGSAGSCGRGRGSSRAGSSDRSGYFGNWTSGAADAAGAAGAAGAVGAVTEGAAAVGATAAAAAAADGLLLRFALHRGAPSRRCRGRFCRTGCRCRCRSGCSRCRSRRHGDCCRRRRRSRQLWQCHERQHRRRDRGRRVGLEGVGRSSRECCPTA